VSRGLTSITTGPVAVRTKSIPKYPRNPGIAAATRSASALKWRGHRLAVDFDNLQIHRPVMQSQPLSVHAQGGDAAPAQPGRKGSSPHRRSMAGAIRPCLPPAAVAASSRLRNTRAPTPPAPSSGLTTHGPSILAQSIREGNKGRRRRQPGEALRGREACCRPGRSRRLRAKQHTARVKHGARDALQFAAGFRRDRPHGVG